MLRETLKAYMIKFEGSFVGFFETSAMVLEGLANEWYSHSLKEGDLKAKEWSDKFRSCSKSISEVAKTMAEIRNEHDKIYYPAT